MRKRWLSLLVALVCAAGNAQERPVPKKTDAPGSEHKKQAEAIFDELSRRTAIFNLFRIGITARLPGDPEWEKIATAELLQRLQEISGAKDDRHEIFEAPPNPRVQTNIAATAAVFHDGSLKPAEGSGNDWQLSNDVRTAKSRYTLCDGEPFEKQKVPAFCTAVLIAPQVVATAGHCIGAVENVRHMIFVFGYACSTADNCREVFSVCDIFQGISVVFEDDRSTNRDWALVKLDRPVKREPVRRRTTGMPAADTKLYMVGHGMGVPLKYVDNGLVLKQMPNSFAADLDAFKHNSGSPVFNADTHDLEGIVVTAGNTFATNEATQCNETVICGAACPTVVMDAAELPDVKVVGAKPECPPPAIF